MELDDLKNLWKEQDIKLGKSIKLNEKLLKNTFTQRANGVIENLLKWAYFSLIEFTIFIIFMLVATYNTLDDWRFLVSGIFILLFLTYCISVGIIDIIQLKKIDLFSQSIVSIKQAILDVKKRSNKVMKILLFSIPLVVTTFSIVGVKFIRGINLFDYPVFLTILAISIIVLSYILAFISYDVLIKRKYKVIEDNLMELESFKAE
jgi:hypothetical protein